MTSAPLFQLVYTSIYRAGRVSNELSALRSILSASRRNNQAAGVTGFLIFDRDSFLQVLEGPRDALDATMARIAQDDRHRDVSVLAVRRSGSAVSMPGRWAAAAAPRSRIRFLPPMGWRAASTDPKPISTRSSPWRATSVHRPPPRPDAPPHARPNAPRRRRRYRIVTAAAMAMEP